MSLKDGGEHAIGTNRPSSPGHECLDGLERLGGVSGVERERVCAFHELQLGPGDVFCEILAERLAVIAGIAAVDHQGLGLDRR